MSLQTSVLEALLRGLPQLRPQLYFKSSLTALSHAMEDLVLAGRDAALRQGSIDRPLVIASFQRERFYRQEAHRYARIAALTPNVYVLAAPETSFVSASQEYETIAFEASDRLSHEWHLVVIGQGYATCLVCQEVGVEMSKTSVTDLPAMDQTRRFEGVWTFDRTTSCQAAAILLDRIAVYRPELAEKIAQAKIDYLSEVTGGFRGVDPDPFAQRLVTYIQASQYKLQKAYRSIAAKEQQERLVNSITDAVRRSLDPDEIFRVAVQELGQAMQVCRCLIYPCRATDASVRITYEALSSPTLDSLVGQTWTLQDNPLFQAVVQRQESMAVSLAGLKVTAIANLNSCTTISELLDFSPIQERLDCWQIRSWLLVPILYQGRWLGMVELQHCQAEPHTWSPDEVGLVEAIATQLGVALIQAEAFANLEDLNEQLEALERTRSNLIAITGHELRTPLSTIQVCLESLASEPDMIPELRQAMLSTALTDADRMRKLIQDFLTLSRLESGRVQWHLEPISLDECVELALSSVRIRLASQSLPPIRSTVSLELPPVQADGEWLVEVLTKILDNACKFTPPEGEVVIEAKRNDSEMLEVTITDTGRGIEPEKLEVVFDRFYQEEGALRRTTGGTGLGLAICRQIVKGLGGDIWAESAGRDKGSQFHFTLPIAGDPSREPRNGSKAKSKTPARATPGTPSKDKPQSTAYRSSAKGSPR